MPSPKDPVKREEWIAKLQAAKKKSYADPNSGYNKPEYREKQRVAHLGKSLSSVHCAAIGAAHRGKKYPKLSAAQIRYYKDPANRAKISIALKNNPKIMGENNVSKRPEVRAAIGAATTGEKNGNWKGGPALGDYPLAFNKKLKQFIRNRDKVCQLCGKTKEQESRNLCVHHINHDYNDLFELNLISLCKSCNGKVNANSDFWEDYFNYNILIGCKG